MKNVLVPLLLVLIVVVCGFRHASAQTMEEIYQMRCRIFKGTEPTESRMAAYFIDLGQSELVRINGKQKLGREKLSANELKLQGNLESALEPILTLEHFVGKTERFAENQPRLSRLNQDASIARKSFAALGSKRALEMCQQSIAEFVAERIRRDQLNSHGPICLLVDEDFAEVIGIKDDQSQRIEKLVEETGEKFRNGPGKEFSDLERLLQQHWVALRRELDAEQRKKAEALIGDPVQWFRCVEPLQFRNQNGRGYFEIVVDNRMLELARKRGKMISELTAAEMEQEGYTVFHNHFLGMMKSSFVWDELELSESQRKKLHSDFAGMQLKKQFIVHNQHLQRLDEMLSGDLELPEYAQKQFNAHQQTWLKHFEFQMLTGEHEPSLGLLHPHVAESLTLSKSQQANIKKLAGEFEKQRSTLETNLAERRTSILQQMSKDISRILTYKQNELYTDFTGQSLGQAIEQPEKPK